MFCEYCNSEFKNKYTLESHKQTAKYCLKIQENMTVNNLVNSKYICDYCNKIYTTKQNLLNHLNTCKEKIYNDKAQEILKIKEKELEFLNKELENKNNLIVKLEFIETKYLEQVKELQNKNHLIDKLELIQNKHLEQIKEQKEHITELENRIERLSIKAINKSGNTTNHNNTINLELNNFMSQDYIDNKIGNKFSDKYIINGMKSIAQFVYDHIIRTEDGTLLYGCYDASRKIFKYKDDKGSEVKDIKAQKLIGLIQPGLKKQTKVLHDFFFLEHEDLEKLENDRELNKSEKKEKEKMKYLKDKTVEIVTELNEMKNNNKFSNELAILTI